MDQLEELENRIIRLVKVNNLEFDPKDKVFEDEELDAFEFGFAMALKYVLGVIIGIKDNKNKDNNGDSNTCIPECGMSIKK